MTHSYTNEHDDPHPTPTHSEIVRQAEHDSDASEVSAENAALLRLFAADNPRERGSTPVHAAAVQQAQRVHGNRAVQRFIQQRKLQVSAPIQKSPWDDWPLRPSCPIVSVGPQIGCEPLGRGGPAEPAKQPPVSPSNPAPKPGKKGKQPKPGKPAKGKKGGKPGDADPQGGFTMTLEEFIKLTGYNPLRQLEGDTYGPGGLWPRRY